METVEAVEIMIYSQAEPIVPIVRLNVRTIVLVISTVAEIPLSLL